MIKRGKHFLYFLRKPIFPVICQMDGFLVCGKSEAGLHKWLENATPPATNRYHLIDAAMEPWSLDLESGFISPSWSEGRRCTKLRLIELFNESRNSADLSERYSTKSLSAKTQERIFQDIYALVERSLKIKAPGE